MMNHEHKIQYETNLTGFRKHKKIKDQELFLLFFTFFRLLTKLMRYEESNENFQAC